MGKRTSPKALPKLKPKIHFTFDFGTSPNHRSVLDVVAPWLDSDKNLKNKGLDMRRFQGLHTGENQVTNFWDIITSYKIEDRIGYFSLDNESNNDTALQHIASYLAAINTSFKSIHRRLRCFEPILNLVVRGFLWGEDPENF